MAAKTKLAFEAKIAGVKIEPAKDNYGSTGKLLVTLVVDQPKPPAPPSVPYNLQGRWINGAATIKERPSGNVPHQKKETPEDYEKRVAQRASEQEEYDAAADQYQLELAKHQRRLETFGPRLMSYAQLIGIAGVFGGQPVSVVIMPNQDLLPAFALSLVSEEEAAASVPQALIDATPARADEPEDLDEVPWKRRAQAKAEAEAETDQGPEVEPEAEAVAVPRRGRRSKAESTTEV